jgi:hypothetical protein
VQPGFRKTISIHNLVMIATIFDSRSERNTLYQRFAKVCVMISSIHVALPRLVEFPTTKDEKKISI